MNISKQSIIKELKSWGFFVILLGGLYITGALPEVSALIQRGLLMTGLMNASSSEEYVGKTDYNWKLEEFESGERIDFSAFKGKKVFLNVWASWCPPCIAEMPSIEKLYQHFKGDDNVVFIMLNVDEDKLKAEKFLKRKGYSFPIYRRITSTPSIFQSNSIPSTYVINEKGEVIFKHQGLANYYSDSFINMLTIQ
ncbi:TlpA disulfide reductase family protein [Flammeovirga sp. EKP202]|uniref:TlpA family protein disulfide reductase n=1 Tax=Flammeovirga sp. EKP202 TaxID=2770592 RepID=UPI00165EEC1C|nr:TlpA disulfide reductase family protein [Flammeovirga sp. EKP202]MBD0403145.1 TlpA family protein disulfide reductase [Flammeovirga sp. EKP202]